MLRITRLVVGSVVAVAIAGLGLQWTLGEDFRPWIRTAQKTAAGNIAALVDKYEMELEKARMAVERSRERAAALRTQKHQAAVAVKSLERELVLSQRETSEARSKLAQLNGQLTQGKLVTLVSGRTATLPELKGLVTDYGNRIQIAQEKVSYLEQLLVHRNTRCQKLTELEEQSPAAIQRLQNSVDHLERKIAMYREIKQWADEDSSSDTQLAGLFEKAQRTLEEAHASLDGKLAELDVILQASTQLEPAPVREPASTEGVLAEIHSILDQKLEVATNK